MDWAKWRNEYWTYTTHEFERWLFERFYNKFDACDIVRLDQQDLLLINLWKVGPRNVGRIVDNHFPVDLGQIAHRSPVELDDIRSLVTRLESHKGIGVPVASAALCLVRPNTFPVIDRYAIKAVQLVFHSLIDVRLDSISIRNYLEYTHKVYSILRGERDVSGWSLRDVDRALWAYGRAAMQNST